jgi:hypothetical protein
MSTAPFGFLFLLPQSASAYATEAAGNFREAYHLHMSALAAFEKFEKSLSFFSSTDRQVTRQVKRKIGLHNERIKALKAYLGGGKKDPNFLSPPRGTIAINQRFAEIFPSGMVNLTRLRCHIAS